MTLKPRDDTTTKKLAPKLKAALGRRGTKITQRDNATEHDDTGKRIDGCAAKITFALKDPKTTIRETSRSKC